MKPQRSVRAAAPNRKGSRSVAQRAIWWTAEILALAGIARRAVDPIERHYGALRPGEDWRSLPATIRAERVAILNRIKDRGLRRVLAEFLTAGPDRARAVRRFATPGPVAPPVAPRQAASDAEGSFEFLRAAAQRAEPVDHESAEGLVRSFYVARLFEDAVQAFESRLTTVARHRPGDVAFETLRAYTLSLVRLGRAEAADRYVSELADRFSADPDVTCCLAIVRLSTDPDGARELFERSLELGQERQLALNYAVALMLRDGEPAPAIRARLDGRLRLHSRRAEARGDTALLDALLSASEDDGDSQLYHLNRCLTFQGLTRLVLRDETKVLSPWNLRAAVRRREATGPLVSILVTTFNSAEFVEGSLRSLLEQTYRDLDIVVCDDASQDRTVEIVERMAAADPRIRVVRNTMNVGTYASKNAGFLHSRGDLVTCHDSDDWAHPQKIESQVDSILARPGRIGSRSLWVRVDDRCRPVLAAWGAFLHANPASLLLRREVFETVGLFDSVRVAADSEFLNRVRLVYGAESISTVRGCLSLGLDRADSLTRGGAFGFTVDQRSRAREAYWAAWANWHIQAQPDELTIPFPPSERPFRVPQEIDVPVDAIRANLVEQKL